MTSLIEWREQFAIGLPEVDHEHRDLIATINALHARLGPTAPAVEVVGALGDIHSAVAAHFALEERSMAQLGYPALPAHKADHECLLDEILDIMDGVAAAQDYSPAALSATLADWFGLHFRTHDSELHHWLVRLK
jgi:hemerythrin-like metal-binding protein